jgi:hypothetical protein
MPEHDDGDRLRRELLRQAPEFDLGASFAVKVSALVRRRQRIRRGLAVGAAVVVVAAVAIPLSALRSSPVGRGVTPGTTPTSAPVTTTPGSVSTTTPSTIPADVQPLSCDTLDLWTTPSGTPVTTSTTLGGVTATLTGTTATSVSSDPSLADPQLTVVVGTTRYSETVAPPAPDNVVVPWSLTPTPSSPTTPNSDALCLAHFPGQSLPTLLIGLDTNGAHCCTVVRAITVSTAGLAPAVDDNVGNPGAEVQPDGDDALIVTAVNAFAYQFSSYAESGMPIEVLQFSDGRFVDITGGQPDLVTTDAAMWWKAFTSNDSTGNGLGVLAAWVADEVVLGQKDSAWAVVDELEAQGKLVGPAGWPSGAAYVMALKTFLTKQGYD